MSFCPAILPKCPRINYVKKNAVRIREFLELSAYKLFSLISNDYQRRTKILDPPLCNTLCHSFCSLIHNRNAQLVQRTPTHHVAENDFGTVWIYTSSSREHFDFLKVEIRDTPIEGLQRICGQQLTINGIVAQQAFRYKRRLEPNTR